MDEDLKTHLEEMETRLREHTEEMTRELREHTEAVETRDERLEALVGDALKGSTSLSTVGSASC